MILIIFLPLLVFSNPSSKRPLFVKKHESSQMGGHTIQQVQTIIANFERFELPQRVLNRYRVATTDDEEILMHLSNRKLISGFRRKLPAGRKRPASRQKMIPKNVLRNFAHLMANLPNDVEGSGFY